MGFRRVLEFSETHIPFRVTASGLISISNLYLCIYMYILCFMHTGSDKSSLGLLLGQGLRVGFRGLTRVLSASCSRAGFMAGLVEGLGRQDE